ncbi:MBL fold metallo-hydrolase [Clostridium kluyveri]|uniref:Metallo-beta-lactamase domain-containing protein n=2 Tax=Clostridium kluyveri TaxID=1534 RepID=A5MZT5_CLOK5|nr:MBL fold metallo-hydrolase [Clostridium kluyveri]EDK34381.1 Conserved hypothetical protein [Clostridium kluyveri DSM 555]BAH07139.1 hypothetical protein CKR_2088 [Clostridium kluyveri NBRC 12016]
MVFKLGKTRKISGNVYVVRTLVSNFFIYSNYGAAVCFNSGFIPCVVNRELGKIDIKPESISNVFITYPHFYNMGGIKLFKNSNIYIPSKVFDKKLKYMEFNKKKKNRTKYIKVQDGDVLNIGNIKIKAIVFPGHKRGAISYMVNDSILFI